MSASVCFYHAQSACFINGRANLDRHGRRYGIFPIGHAVMRLQLIRAPRRVVAKIGKDEGAVE